MASNGLSRNELLQIQGWLSGVLWDIRHAHNAHAGQTLICLLKGLSERSGQPVRFEDWPEEAVQKINVFQFDKEPRR